MKREVCVSHFRDFAGQKTRLVRFLKSIHVGGRYLFNADRKNHDSIVPIPKQIRSLIAGDHRLQSYQSVIAPGG
jgi:hypothetical protein